MLRWESWELNPVLKTQTLPIKRVLNFIQCDSHEIYCTGAWEKKYFKNCLRGKKKQILTICIACSNICTRQMFVRQKQQRNKPSKVNCTFSDYWSLTSPSQMNHTIVLSTNTISQIECLAFLWCLLSHKTSCHLWPESWYNKPEYANGKQSKLAYGFLVEELHQWNSRALQTFPAIRTFAHRNNKTVHRRKSILLLWVMKISKHHLQEFLTVESSERLPNYIDLSCTEIIISLSPYLIQFLNPCDRWILTPKLASVILPSDWSE